MLDKLSAGDLRPLLGQPCILVAGSVEIEAVVDQVIDKPLAQHPYAAPDRRMPFTLLVSTVPDCPWGDGLYLLRVPGMADIPDIYFNRVLNVKPFPASIFQAAFN